MADAAGSGTRRQYSYRDLLELKVIKSLLDSGLKLESVRTVFEYVREQLGEDVATTNLVIQGKRSVLVQSGDELIDVLQQGQGVLNVLPLAGVKEELDAKIVELRPAPEGTVADDAPDVAVFRPLGLHCHPPRWTRPIGRSAPNSYPSAAGTCRSATRPERWLSTAPVVPRQWCSTSVTWARCG